MSHSINFIDMTGLRFGRFLVLGQAGKYNSQATWRCVCDCGREKVVLGAALRDGTTKSCGCFRTQAINESNRRRGLWHGDKNHPLYPTWRGIIARCTQKRSLQYQYYGGRGITICEAWKDFDQFVKDVGERPGPKYSIDRIDNNGNYEPGNVRWATAQVQSSNRRRVRELEIKNQELKAENQTLRDENARLRQIVAKCHTP